MPDEHVGEPLWSQLSRLALCVGGGRLMHPGILAAGCRGALAIDAVEHGILTLDGDQVHFDSDVASGLMAQLVDGCEHHPRRTLAQLFQRGAPHLSDFVEALVDQQVWQRHGLVPGADFAEYRDRDAAHYERLQSQLTDAGPFRTSSPHVAALVALATVLNLRAGSHRTLPEPDPEVLEATGPLKWIVTDVTTYLLDAQATDLAAGQADGVSVITPLATS